MYQLHRRMRAAPLTSYHITSTTQPNLSASIWVARDLRPVFLPLAARGGAGECARGDPSIVTSGNRWIKQQMDKKKRLVPSPALSQGTRRVQPNNAPE